MLESRIVLILTSGAMLLAGCEHGATSAPDTRATVPVPAQVTVSGPATITVGAKAQFAATVTDRNGAVLGGIPISWTTDAPTVATVDGAGMVTAVASGSVTVTAAAGVVTGNAVVVSAVPPLRFCKPDGQLDSWCRLTDAPTNHTFPSVSGNRVVWVDQLTPATRVIVMLDLVTGLTTRLTPDTLDTNVPTIDGDRVVYARLPANVGDWQLLTYDLKTGRESQFSTISRDVGLGRFSLSGNRVAWHTRRNNNWDVYVFDFTTNQETRITTDPADQADPAIFGDRVAWSDRRQNATWWDLYAYDLRTNVETRITQSPTLGRSPAISADRIVWGDIRGGFFTLYEYNFTRADHERNLNAGPLENSIVMAGSHVAWYDAGADIVAFDIATGRQVQVTKLPSTQRLPTISQDYLAWEDYRNGQADVYIARLIDVFKP